MTRAIFVTGTDTGVGKTTFSVGLLAAWRSRGLRVAALKPAETGCCAAQGEALWPEDAARLRFAAGQPEQPISNVCPNRYALPAAPSVAARHEGRAFDLDAVRQARVALVASAPHVLLIEGAGGLLVPYGPELTGADVARAMAPIAVLVVARAGLGTINHTALTVAELRRRDLPIAGIVLNRVVADADASEADNAVEIQALTGERVLGTLPHIPDAATQSLDTLAAAVETAVDVDALFGTLPLSRPGVG